MVIKVLCKYCKNCAMCNTTAYSFIAHICIGMNMIIKLQKLD